MKVEFNRCEWDDEKAALNLEKHGVAFEEASTVLDDELASTFSDEEHSEDETRFITIGRSISGSILVVMHTERSDLDRIISARKATRRERRDYEDADAGQ